jgi:hypothetical protein
MRFEEAVGAGEGIEVFDALSAGFDGDSMMAAVCDSSQSFEGGVVLEA